MTTLLQKWRRKKSWKATFPIALIYFSRKTGEKDLSLSSLCEKESALTLNPSSGFNEIAVSPIREEVRDEWQHLITPLPTIEASPREIADRLLREVENYLVETWDGNRFHLVFCSAGMDSRILSWVLTKLRKEQGRSWLGELHFRCYEPEGQLFKKAMQAQGWKQDEYSVYREGRVGERGYMTIGRFETDVNTFHRSPAEWWDDIIREEKDVVLVQGFYGSEIFSYPLWPNWRLTDNRYEDLMHNARQIRVRATTYAYKKWRDVLNPYLGYGFLDTAFRVPRKHFRWVERSCVSEKYRNMNRRDLIRTRMLARFGDRLPVYVSPRVNLLITKRRMEYMKRNFHESRFYRDFKHLSFVRDAEPWMPHYTGRLRNMNHDLSLKLYGYATMYENVGCS